MLLSRNLLTAAAVISAAVAHGPILGKRAPFEAVGIESNTEGFGAPIAKNDDLAALAPPSQFGSKKNATMPQLKDRSLELVDRQSCDAGYGYCASFDRCCPDTNKCCAWGYCIDPDDTCCQNGPCDPGENCCGTNHCSPKSAQCCSDESYCEAGNQCVILGSTNEIVCCTDLECTAHVLSGTTVYLTTTSFDADPTTITLPPATITPPPEPTTRFVTVEDSYTTWYWTVTWWYFSYYWSTYRQVESTVTYTKIYETTTFTTTATDEYEASSLFFALSQSLSFTPPAAAQTTLASLLDAVPSETSSFSIDIPFNTDLPSDTSTSARRSSSSDTTSASITPQEFNPPPGGSAASGVFVQWMLVGLGLISGVLMVWL